MVEELSMKSKEKKLELKDSTIYQTNENCQVFNGPISGCVFAMPGATVNQNQHIHMGEQGTEVATAAGDTEETDTKGQRAEPVDASPPQEELNLFAPKKNLQELLKQTWFADVRSDSRYDARWTEGFVEALMASEYGEGIARQWAVTGARNKRNQLKAYVVGLLKDAGVLKGSYVEIGNMTGLNNEKRTFSTNMSRGKKQPYAEWVKEYVLG